MWRRRHVLLPLRLLCTAPQPRGTFALAPSARLRMRRLTALSTSLRFSSAAVPDKLWTLAVDGHESRKRLRIPRRSSPANPGSRGRPPAARVRAGSWANARPWRGTGCSVRAGHPEHRWGRGQRSASLPEAGGRVSAACPAQRHAHGCMGSGPATVKRERVKLPRSSRKGLI